MGRGVCASGGGATAGTRPSRGEHAGSWARGRGGAWRCVEVRAGTRTGAEGVEARKRGGVEARKRGGVEGVEGAERRTADGGAHATTGTTRRCRRCR